MDLQQQQRTASAYYNLVRRFLQSHEFTVEEIRAFLSEIEKPNTYNNWLKAFIAYAKYLGASLPFRLRRPPETVRPLRTKKELQEFFYALETDAERTLFIGYAVTGLRRRELLNLKVCQVNFELRAVFPNHGSVTKRSYITFYNEELEELLDVWLRLRSKRSDRLFPMRSSEQSSIFLTAYRKTGLRITPQDLRL
ncbi:MAG: hypothetical protein QXZ09_07245, partial [Candidatus Methanomethylicaceae archaeon]